MFVLILFLCFVSETFASEIEFSDKNSNLLVKVFKDEDGYGAFLAHNHAVQAVDWSSNFKYESSSCNLSISVPVSKLNVDPPDLRKKLGGDFEGVVSDGDRKTIKENMLASDQLNASKYSTIEFKSESCELSGADSKIKGQFTLRGVTKSVSIPISFSESDGTVSLKGTLPIKSTDYGFEPYSAMFGQIANRAEMEIEFDLKSK